jgi:hypothetical protein
MALAVSFMPEQYSDGGSGSVQPVEASSVLQHVTDSSKSPALLSLLLSCVKQLQHSCHSSTEGALAAAGLAGVIGDLTVELYKLCVTFQAQIAGPGSASRSVGVSADSSSSAPGFGIALDVMQGSTEAPRVLAFGNSTAAPTDDSTPSEPSATQAAPSTGSNLQPQAAGSAGGEETAPSLIAEATS